MIRVTRLASLLSVVSVLGLILTGCTGTMPTTEEGTTQMIRTTGETEPAESVSPAERAFHNASEYYQIHEIGKAIENYQEAIALDPGFVQAYHGLGNIYLVDTQEFEKAAEMYEKARELAPEDAYSHASLAYAYFVIGRYQEAVQEYVEAIQLDPSDADTYVNLGYTYEKMDMGLAAMNAYRRAMELRPQDTRVALTLAQLYYRAQLYEQAIAAYEKVRQIGTPGGHTLRTLGWLYMKVGRNEKAENLFLAALAQDPTDAVARTNLATNYRATQQFGKAAEQYEILAEQQPTNIDLLLALADAYNNVGNYAGAISTARQVLSLAPGNGSAYVSWAKALEKQGASFEAQERFDDAIAQYEAAIAQLEKARGDSEWRSHAGKEIDRQNRLIEIAQQKKLRKIWEGGG